MRDRLRQGGDRTDRCGVSPAPAVLTDRDANNTTTFVGGGTSWTTPGNWSLGVPDSSLCAVIPADDSENEHFNVVFPGSTTASCKTLNIGNEGDDKNTLFLTDRTQPRPTPQTPMTAGNVRPARSRHSRPLKKGCASLRDANFIGKNRRHKGRSPVFQKADRQRTRR